jgi:hypothetical protein
MAMRVSPPGRLSPGGGIISRRSFRITASARSRSEAAWATSNPDRERLPVRSWSLWQILQVRRVTWFSSSSVALRPEARTPAKKPERAAGEAGIVVRSDAGTTSAERAANSCAGATFCRESPVSPAGPGGSRQGPRGPAGEAASDHSARRRTTIWGIQPCNLRAPPWSPAHGRKPPLSVAEYGGGGWKDKEKVEGRGAGSHLGFALRPSGGDPPGGSPPGGCRRLPPGGGSHRGRPRGTPPCLHGRRGEVARSSPPVR